MGAFFKLNGAHSLILVCLKLIIIIARFQLNTMDYSPGLFLTFVAHNVGVDCAMLHGWWNCVDCMQRVY